MVFSSNSAKYFYWLTFAVAAIAYLIGLPVDPMDIDSAQYISISNEMIQNGSYLVVKHRLHDYLDKPPLLFWTSVLSFKVFGIHNWSFKLFSFLFTLLGSYSVYRLAKRLYNAEIGAIAALLLFTCQAFFSFNNDVRTDTLLAGATAFALWQAWAFLESKEWLNWLGTFVGIALAMLAKGPIGIMVTLLALGGHIVWTWRWKELLDWRWYAGLVFIGVLLLPMSYGLYKQFGWEGVRFFYWTQSFGRLTGENYFKNDAGYFFFTHTFLWEFLPWSLLAVLAFGTRIWDLLRELFSKQRSTEIYTVAGFVLPFVALSMSQYKLPHYINVVFSMVAIFTAAFIHKVYSDKGILLRFFFGFQSFVGVAILGLVIYLGTTTFPVSTITFWLLFSIVAVLAVYVLFAKAIDLHFRFLLFCAISVSAANLYLNAQAYPQLLCYQSGSVAGRIAKLEAIDEEKLYQVDAPMHSFEYYAGQFPKVIRDTKIDSLLEKKGDIWVYGDGQFLGKAQQEHKVLKRYTLDEFSVTLLSPRFLNPATRKETLKTFYLLHLGL